MEITFDAVKDHQGRRKPMDRHLTKFISVVACGNIALKIADNLIQITYHLRSPSAAKKIKGRCGGQYSNEQFTVAQTVIVIVSE